MAWFDPKFSPGYMAEGVVGGNSFAGGLAIALPLLGLVVPNVNLMLYGNFGLGPLQFDAKAQLNACLSASLAWNPQAAIMANAQVGLALSGLIPSFKVNAALAANLQLKIGGIQLLMNLGLKLLLVIPPIIAGLNLFFNLPGAYFAVYYGPIAQIRPWGNIQAQLGGAPNVAMLTIAISTGAITATAWEKGLSTIFTTSNP